MVCLVTGCNGLAGSYMARQLLASGFQVKALRRPNSDLQHMGSLASQITWIEGDILDVLSLEKAMEGCNYVVHAAGLVSFHKKDHSKLLKINVEGTANVVNTCLAYSGVKLCHVSSIAAIGYDDQRPDKTLTERQKWNDELPQSQYAISKHLAEKEVWRGIEEGLKAVIVNPSVILGAGNWQRSSLKIFDRMAHNPLGFYPPGFINYVDVRDVAKLTVALLQRGTTGERFILNAGTTSYQHFFSEIAQRFGHPAPSKALSPWMGNIAWRWESVKSVLSGTPPAISAESMKAAFQKHTYSSQKVLDQFNYTYLPLHRSLDDICGVFLQQKDTLPLLPSIPHEQPNTSSP